MKYPVSSVVPFAISTLAFTCAMIVNPVLATDEKAAADNAQKN